MREGTRNRHDALIRERGEEIAGLLRRRPNADLVAKELGIPRSVVRGVKGQLPDSQMRRRDTKKNLYTDDHLAEHLRIVQARMGGDAVLTERAYTQHRNGDDPSRSLYPQRFGTWNAALRFAGLPTNAATRKPGAPFFSRTDCIAAVQQAAKELGEAPTYEHYEAWAKARAERPSGQTVRNRLGRWLTALDAAGL